MKLQDIYQFFQTSQPIFLKQELATCYILSVLLDHHSYGTELIENLEQQFSPYQLSDTVLTACLRFLEAEGIITSYQKKLDGRGRPRRMYQIQEQALPIAKKLAQFWHQYHQKRYRFS